VALAVILLTGAGLMFQSFLRLQAVDPGFKPQRVAAFDVGLNGARYDSSARQRQFYREARERLIKVPGVRAAAAISNLPLGGVESLGFFFIEGAVLRWLERRDIERDALRELLAQTLIGALGAAAAVDTQPAS